MDYSRYAEITDALDNIFSPDADSFQDYAAKYCYRNKNLAHMQNRAEQLLDIIKWERGQLTSKEKELG